MDGQQLSLAQTLLHPGVGANARLDAIDRVIDWRALAALARKARGPKHCGRPSYAALPLLKAVYLQMLYGLSDKGLEEALGDRLSFQRFCGYTLDRPMPDETTICRFRHELAAAGALEACFEEVNRQLDAQKLIVRKGTLMDATILPAASRRRGIKEGEGARAARRPGADWTRKNGRSYFGCRVHVGTDQGSNLIRRIVLTPASVNESLVAEALMSGDEKAVYADKGYEIGDRRSRLRAAGVKDRICHRSHRHQKELPHWQSVRNKAIAKRRAMIEQVFGTMKRTYGFARARYADFMLNRASLFCFSTMFNLRRAAGLLAA